jgi:hypothetical protein
LKLCNETAGPGETEKLSRFADSSLLENTGKYIFAL